MQIRLRAPGVIGVLSTGWSGFDINKLQKGSTWSGWHSISRKIAQAVLLWL